MSYPNKDDLIITRDSVSSDHSDEKKQQNVITNTISSSSSVALANDNDVYSIKSYSEMQVWHLLKLLQYDDVDNLDNLPAEIEFLGTKLHEISIEESLEIMKEAEEYHFNDPNIDPNQYNEFVRYSSEGVDPENEIDVFSLKALAVLLRDHSPYPEVRAVCPPPSLDDPSIPVETVRSYVLGLIWLVIAAGFNEFFAHRMVSISVSTAVIQMFLYPMGEAWAKWIPCWGVNIRGRKIALNIDSPWTDKEQMFATLCIAISMPDFYPSYNILVQKLYYGQDVSFNYQFWLSLCVQMMGFGFSGILRKFVVYPSKAMWPTSLSTIALNRTLLTPEQASSGDSKKFITRYKLFFIAFLAMLIYQWIPSFLFEGLSTFNWITWIAPDNWKLAVVTGGITGVGLNPIASFDYSVITTTAMTVPFFSTATQYAGALLSILIVLGIYFTNYQHTSYIPIFSNSLFTNKAKKYDVLEILDSDYKFQESKYQNYSPPFYSAGNLVSYGVFISLYPFLITYYIFTEHRMFSQAFKIWGLSIWKLRTRQAWIDLWNDDGDALESFNDPHSKAMRKYREVPDWWYLSILIILVIVGSITLKCFPTNTPVWCLYMSIGFNFVFVIPLALLEATTGVAKGLNILIEMIMGYALPGNPIALMTIKAIGYSIDGQADSYVSNLKLAHYCKISPRAIFRGQLAFAFIQIFINLGVVNWSMSNLAGYCTSSAKGKFTCPDAQVYYNASIMWGSLGPKKIFNDVYPILKWCWLIGFLLGALFAGLKIYGKKYVPVWFNPVIFIVGMSIGPPYGLMYKTPGLIMSFFSQWYARKRHLQLWERYNYVLAAAFNAGLVLASIIIFFAVQFESTKLDWWGNNVSSAGQDKKGIPRFNISDTPKGYFGYAPGHYP
ncbi:hypothetical protein QEN19_004375 [Hanseniaspora menglaensis]